MGGPEFMRESWDAAWADLREHIADGLGFVGEAEDGALTGFVFGTVEPAHPDLCVITDFYVVPAVRRTGFARMLMRRLVGEVERRNIGNVGLEVMLDNEVALGFYRRLGFTPLHYFMFTPRQTLAERLAFEQRPPSVASLHVQTDDTAAVQRAVTQFMPRLGRSEWTRVEAASNGWTIVVDELCDRDRSAQRRLGSELSERLGVPAVAFAVEEEAVVRFLLFDRGRMVDEYLSVPTYYGEVSKADELSLAANPTLAARLTGGDPGRIRSAARVAASPSDLPPARELVADVAAAMNLEARIER